MWVVRCLCPCSTAYVSLFKVVRVCVCVDVRVLMRFVCVDIFVFVCLQVCVCVFICVCALPNAKTIWAHALNCLQCLVVGSRSHVKDRDRERECVCVCLRPSPQKQPQQCGGTARDFCGLREPVGRSWPVAAAKGHNGRRHVQGCKDRTNVRRRRMCEDRGNTSLTTTCWSSGKRQCVASSTAATFVVIAVRADWVCVSFTDAVRTTHVSDWSDRLAG